MGGGCGWGVWVGVGGWGVIVKSHCHSQGLRQDKMVILEKKKNMWSIINTDDVAN